LHRVHPQDAEERLSQIRRVRWDIVGPVGLVVVALIAVLWLDVAKGGEAKPEAPLGAIGTPVRNAYVGPTATPFGFAPTARPRPTAPPGQAANIAARDEKRRADLLLLLAAAGKVKERDGSYPTTNGNLQTLCNYKDIDVGCKLIAAADNGSAIGDPSKVGYWYASNGQSVQIYASLEGDIPKEEQCPTNDTELKKHDNIICVKAP
jgi:hypothetical protein